MSLKLQELLEDFDIVNSNEVKKFILREIGNYINELMEELNTCQN